ncbi:MAG: DUF3769 domain-containing protein [Coleofasciculus sp. Co-bin14]|nr:DUF3769 domain-containing protein [Coleofasciculus sp. Co-bin14]
MPQPIQPPETPAIVQPVASENALSLNQSSNKTPISVSNRTLPPGLLATPTPTETFAPEYSLLTAHKSAALLGPPISIGYPIQPSAETVPSPTSSGISSQVTSQGSNIREPETASAVASQESNVKQPESASNFSHFTTQSSSVSDSKPVASEGISVQPVPPKIGLLPSNLSFPTPGTSNVKRLVTQERGGEVREFKFSVPTPQAQASPNQPAPPQETVIPTPNSSQAIPQPPAQASPNQPTSPQETVIPTPNPSQATPQPPASPESGTPVPVTPFSIGGVIELTADRQEYDEQKKIVTAIGNVMLRFREALLNADRVSVNLTNRLIVAEGNVALTRGDQVLRGDRFDYYLVQDSGVILNASGELYTPTTGTDLSLLPPPGSTNTTVPPRPISDRITANEPLQGITNPGGYTFVVGAGTSATNVAAPQTGGTINRYRYQAERVDFDGKGAIATNVRITNDPFSPPELELRADKARFTRLEPLVDEVVATRPRLVFDQGLEIPTFRNRITIDRRQRDPSPFNIGYDGEDRGGLYVERTIEILNTPNVRFSVTPQYLIQKAFTDGSFIDPSVFGVKARLDGVLSPRTTVTGRAVLTTLDTDGFEDNLRASLRLQQIIGTTLPHTLSLEYSYRDRLFNGSLGYQTVQSSLGAVLASPNISLGNTGINLYYQVGAQYINAETDRRELLEPDRENNRVSLARYQALAILSRDFVLWRGQALPATPTEGLRYSPTPIRPNIRLNTDLTGVFSAYSSGDSQESLSGGVRLIGQFGHFSRPFLDYTRFNIGYTQVLRGGLSPFLFDRIADRSILSGGILQQIYGPFRFGFQTSFNLETGREISTDYILQYSRRTYNIELRYNPVLQLGSINFRINDFNWTGNPGPFDGSEVRPVVEGVTR